MKRFADFNALKTYQVDYMKYHLTFLIDQEIIMFSDFIDSFYLFMLFYIKIQKGTFRCGKIERAYHYNLDDEDHSFHKNIRTYVYQNHVLLIFVIIILACSLNIYSYFFHKNICLLITYTTSCSGNSNGTLHRWVCEGNFWRDHKHTARSLLHSSTAHWL